MLLFRQFVNDDLGCASYLVGDAEAGVAVAVDPPFEIEPLVEAAGAGGVRIERILETHTHADHVSGHGRFALEHGVPVAIHPLAEPEYPADPLTDGQVVSVGSVGIRIVHTPGHRPEHCSFVVDEQLVLTGDSLFVGDAARPDLAVAAREGAEALHGSLARLSQLPDELEMYPGHVAGSLCGSHMSPDRSSTIGRERRTNELLRHRDVQEFVLVSASVSAPKPPTTPRVVALNRGRWVARPDDPPELHDAGGATLLDVRPFPSYVAGHVPGAINVPVDGASFGTKTGFVLGTDEPIVLHAGTRREALAAAWKLWAVGLFALRGYMLSPDASETLPIVGPDDLRCLVDDPAVQVLDVRESSERDGGYLPGSTNIPYRLLRKLGGAGTLEHERPVVTVCESGPRAAIAASLLKREGFDVRAVAGGGLADLGDGIVAFRRCGS